MTLIYLYLRVMFMLDWLWDGPGAYVGVVQGAKIWDLSHTGFRGSGNYYVDLAVPAATDALRALCLGVAALAVLGMLLNQFLRRVRLPAAILKGLYVLALVAVCASLFALRSRPEPWTYAASLPLQTTISTQRPRDAPPSETVAPGLTVHFDCIYGPPCGIRAGQGCSAYPNEPAFDQLMVRRDEQRGWWVFDTGSAQLVFRDGDYACISPSYVHVLDAVRPSTGTYVLAIALVALATLMLDAAMRASAREESATARFRGFAVVLCSAWSLYPMLPALLTVWL
jgi:hypothetical protein